MSRKAVIISVICGVAILVAVAALIYSGVRREKTVTALLADISDGDAAARAAAATKIAAYRDGRTAKRIVALLDEADEAQERDIVAALSAIGRPAVRPLLDELREGDPAWVERVTAMAFMADRPAPGVIQALVAVGQPALPGLHDMLKSAGPGARALSASALGAIADASSVDPLKAAMNDADAMVRAEAVWALGEMKTPAALEALLGASRDTDAAVRKAMANSLGQFSDDRVMEPLSTLARDVDPEVGALALLALGRTCGPKSLDILISQLKSPESDIEDAAARALGELGDRRAVGPLIEAATANEALARWAVIDALRKLGDPKAIPVYIAALSDSDLGVQRAAAFALEGTTEEAARQPMIALLRNSMDERVRSAAAYGLCGFSDSESAEALFASGADDSERVRRAATGAFGRRKDDKARQCLYAAAVCNDGPVRAMAASALKNFHTEETMDLLVELLEERELEVRKAAAISLGYSKSDRAIEPLNRRLLYQYSGSELRQAVAAGLAILRSERSVDPLIKALGDPDNRKESVGEYVVLALLTIGTDKAVAAVREAVPDSDVQNAAANYRAMIEKGDRSATMPLTVALIRAGDMKMAEDFYWSGSGILSNMAQWWATTKDQWTELTSSRDGLDRPKWPKDIRRTR